jgi:hypothetical protein
MTRKKSSPWENAYAAKINDQGLVEQVMAIPYCDDDDAQITQYCNENGMPGTWIDTSFRGTRRGKYAAYGDAWDATNFISGASGVDPITG